MRHYVNKSFSPPTALLIRDDFSVINCYYACNVLLLCESILALNKTPDQKN